MKIYCDSTNSTAKVHILHVCSLIACHQYMRLSSNNAQISLFEIIFDKILGEYMIN